MQTVKRQQTQNYQQPNLKNQKWTKQTTRTGSNSSYLESGYQWGGWREKMAEKV